MRQQHISETHVRVVYPPLCRICAWHAGPPRFPPAIIEDGFAPPLCDNDGVSQPLDQMMPPPAGLSGVR